MTDASGEDEDFDGAVADAAFEMASTDVLTAWRVRNAALAVAASFVHPGPDWEDEQARKRLVEEWVSDGHDQVAEENRQRLVAIQRMIAAERVASLADDMSNVLEALREQWTGTDREVHVQMLIDAYEQAASDRELE
jgi:hypothetical protein